MKLPLTSGQIAESIRQETGQNINRDQVNYVILRAGIRPVGRAGRVRLFPPSAVETIRAFLDSMRNVDQPAS